VETQERACRGGAAGARWNIKSQRGAGALEAPVKARVLGQVGKAGEGWDREDIPHAAASTGDTYG